MREDEQDHWSDENENEQQPTSKKQVEIQRLFAEIARVSAQAMRYLVLEGFVEPTDKPGVYKYTPEGLVLASQQHKKMLEDGLLD